MDSYNFKAQNLVNSIKVIFFDCVVIFYNEMFIVKRHFILFKFYLFRFIRGGTTPDFLSCFEFSGAGHSTTLLLISILPGVLAKSLQVNLMIWVFEWL